jgi:dephospho-CoA kinase
MKEIIKRVFAIGGLSESGKSSVGRYLNSKGISRLKIVDFFKEIMKREGPEANFDQWQARTIENRQEWLWKEFIKSLKLKMQTESMKYCALESLYRPGLARALRRAFGEKLIIIYVDTPQEIRLQRQMIRQNLKNIDEAKKYLLPRDENKIKWGALKIKGVADVVIDNSGTMNDLHRQLDQMITKYCPELCQIKE